MADIYTSKIHAVGPDTVNVEAGGLIDIADEHGLKIAGVEITAVNAGAALLEDVVAGTASASKAAVLGTNKNLDELHLAALYLGADAGTQITPTAAKINNLVQGAAADKKINAGTHTVTAGEDSAGTVTIAAGITVAAAVVQVLRAGKAATSDAAISWTTTNLTVADGTTFALTANDVVSWIAFGT